MTEDIKRQEKERICNRLRNRTPERKAYNNKWQQESGYWRRPNARATKAKFQREYSQRPMVKLRYKAKRQWRTFKDKWGVCVLCKSKKAEAHHNDYLEPLKIVWLCSKCHKRVHREHIETLQYETDYSNSHALSILKKYGELEAIIGMMLPKDWDKKDIADYVIKSEEYERVRDERDKLQAELAKLKKEYKEMDYLQCTVGGHNPPCVKCSKCSAWVELYKLKEIEKLQAELDRYKNKYGEL